MKNLSFQITCPGCSDTHFAFTCKKPTLLVPTIVNRKCDECESTVLVQVSIPRERESKRQFAVLPVKIVPSAKLIMRSLEEQAKEESAVSATEISDATGLEPSPVF